MNKSARIYRTSVGQKLLVALTGLFLCSFLVVHVSGNLLLFRNDGGEAFNAFSEFMSTNIIIRVLEVALIAGFLVHILFGMRVWLSSRRARPQGYGMNRPGETSTLTSRWAFWSGSVVFIFLVVHMNSFWVPARFEAGGIPMYRLVTTAFESPGYDLFYLVALFLLGFHLRQGFQSAFQTFGVRPAWRRTIDNLAMIFWLLIPVTFASMPLFFLWSHYMRGGGS